jgi:hypothetical protein
MVLDLENAHRDLWKWCRAQGFAGYDPYDGLNSRLFQTTPFKNFRAARLSWIQFHKRSPLNFRSLVRIPRERNAKGIALFALAALADYRRTRTKQAEIEARELLDDLMWMRLKGFSGACWGYNFDWQSRNFFLPRGTPTIVPTAFAARALCEAAEVFGHEEYLPFVRTVCDFIINDLNRPEETTDEICFSYSPLDRTRVFNASLLAGETLVTVGKLTTEESLIDYGLRAAQYLLRRQREDGSWGYGAEPHQGWSDNFHTAFILTSLSRIISGSEPRAVATGSTDRASTQRRIQTRVSPDLRREFKSQRTVATGLNHQLGTALRAGYTFWRERFFLENGWPKYFPDRLYPADAHSAGAALATLVELRQVDPPALDLAARVARWAVENLRDNRGYFYYQRRRFYRARIPYTRWSEAWMMYGLARLLEGKSKKENGKSQQENHEK